MMNPNSPFTPSRFYTQRRSITIAALALLLACSVLTPAVAQPADTTGEPPFLFIGAFGGVSLVTYKVSLLGTTFFSESIVPPAFPFSRGDGFGFLGGILVDFPAGEGFTLGARLSYQKHDGELLNNFVTSHPDIVSRDGSQTNGTLEGKVETTLGHITFTPYARIEPFPFPVYFLAGPTFLFPSTATYTYSERILEPSGAQFRGTTGRTSRTRVLNKAFANSSTAIGLTAAVGYEYAISDDFRLFGELQVQPTINDYLASLESGETWMATSIQPVIGLRIGIGGSEDPLPPPPIKKPDTLVARNTLDTGFNAKGVTAGGLSDTLTISRKKVQSTEMHALLPYIFFGKDSAIIPSRYVQIDPKNRKLFSIERLPRGNTLDIYYQLLNIVGQRLRDNRRVNITVTGCISQYEEDSTLALRRAQAVKDYLVTVWRITSPDKRIKIVARGLPANPSLSDVDEQEAARENQRVEISSDAYQIERPVQLPDTSTLAPAGVVRFLPPPTSPDSAAGIGGWSLDVKIGDSLVKDAVTGTGAPPAEIDFPIENRPDLDLRAPVAVSSTLIIQDTMYQDLSRITSTSVTVQQQGMFEEERTVEGGKYVDTYTLLLYSFDSSQVAGYAYQAKNIITQRLAPNSVVRIIGHTDRIGLPYYNKQLSQRRAEFAGQLLGVKPKQATGVGEKELLYDNKFPEGRYYSRTATVIVETPLEGPRNLPNDNAPEEPEELGGSEGGGGS